MPPGRVSRADHRQCGPQVAQQAHAQLLRLHSEGPRPGGLPVWKGPHPELQGLCVIDLLTTHCRTI